MSNGGIQRIRIEQVKQYYNILEREYKYFSDTTYNTFKASYINRCSDSYISQLAGKLSIPYETLEKGYKKIIDWWNDYNDAIQSLEKSLSQDNRSYVSESSTNSYVQSNLKRLEDYKNMLSCEISPNISQASSPLFENNAVITNVDATNNIVSGVSIDSDKVKQQIDNTEIHKSMETSIDTGKNFIEQDNESLFITGDENYNKQLESVTNELKSYEELYNTYIDKYKEVINELSVYQEELQRAEAMIVSDIAMPYVLKQQSNQKYYDEIMDQIVKEYGSYDNYKNKIDSLKEELNMFETSLSEIQKQKKLQKYYCLNYDSEFINFTYIDNHNYDETAVFTEEFMGTILSKIEDDGGNPLQYMKAALNNLEKIGLDADKINRDKIALNAEKLLNLLELSEIDPSLEKTYNFLYEKYGLEEANEYLNDIESTVNNILGQKRAMEFLESLNGVTDKKEIEKMVSNHLKTSVKGLNKGFESFSDGMSNFLTAISNMFTGSESSTSYTVGEYETMHIIQALQTGNYGGGLVTNYEVSQGIGNMLPSVLLHSSWLMGISAGGNSYHGALAEGYSNLEALTYGLISGSSEAVLEKVLGGLPGVGKDIKVSNVKSFVNAIASEGFEEGVQTITDAHVRQLLFSENIDSQQLSEDVIKSIKYGMITAGIMQGGASIAKMGLSSIDNIDNIAVGDYTVHKPFTEQINEVNYHTQKGDLLSYTFKLDDISEVTPELLQTINDPSVVKFEIGNEIYDYIDMKKELGLISTTSENSETVKVQQVSSFEKEFEHKTFAEQINEVNYHTQKGNLLSYTFKLDDISEVTPELLQTINDPSVVKFEIGNEIYDYIDMKKELGLISTEWSYGVNVNDNQFDTILSGEISALLGKADIQDYYMPVNFNQLYTIMHTNFDNIIGSNKVNEILYSINIVDTQNWQQLLVSRGLPTSILGFVDRNNNLFLPSNASMHTAVHEVLHKISNWKGNKVYDAFGNIKNVTGLREFYSNGLNTNFTNERITEYFASKLFDGKIYNSQYDDGTNLNLIERFDNLLTYAYKDLNILLNSYIMNDNSILSDFFSKYSTQANYYQFVYALNSEINEYTDYLDSVISELENKFYPKKNTFIDTILSIFKKQINHEYGIVSNKQQVLKKVFDPINNYSNLDSAVTWFFENDGLSHPRPYNLFVSSIGKGYHKDKPSVRQVRRFLNRFNNLNGYYIENQGRYFTHVFSSVSYYNNGSSVSNRLYINAEHGDAYKFVQIFADKCEKMGIPFYFKVANFEDMNMVPEISLTRDESVVIYAEDRFLADYVNICNEIKKENPSFRIYQPPIFTGNIDGFIGYGGESSDHSTSYNSIRSNIMTNAIKTATNYFQQIDPNFNFFEMKKNWDYYSKYLDYINQYIKYYSESVGIDPNNFAFTIN